MSNLPHTTANEQDATYIPAIIGYASVEEWAGIASPWRLVYLFMDVETRRVEGVRHPFISWIITIQQRDPTGVLHCCRIPVLPISAPFSKSTECVAMEYLKHLGRWLKSQHFDLIAGRFAVPADLDLVDATCGFIGWDKLGAHFIRLDQDGGDL